MKTWMWLPVFACVSGLVLVVWFDFSLSAPEEGTRSCRIHDGSLLAQCVRKYLDQYVVEIRFYESDLAKLLMRVHVRGERQVTSIPCNESTVFTRCGNFLYV